MCAPGEFQKMKSVHAVLASMRRPYAPSLRLPLMGGLLLTWGALTGGCGAGAPAGSATPESAQSPAESCIEGAQFDSALPEGAPSSIEVAQILVRHAALKRPQGATRSRGEACLRAQDALAALQQSGDWNATFESYSDAGKATMGHLGTVRPDDLVPPFAAIAFALEPNQLGPVVETERGFHVILRER